MNALKRKPSAQHASAKGTRRRRTGAAKAPNAPHAPHASICHGGHGPCPRKRLDTTAAVAPTAIPARRPRATPAATVITVTGCTPGMAANSTRPAAAAPASAAMRASSFADPGPSSSQDAPLTMSAIATRRRDRPARLGSTAAHVPAAKAATAAPVRTSLGRDRLLAADSHDPVGDLRGEHEVVGHDEGRALVRVCAQEGGKLVLPLG